jgi:hypothetical protein
MQLSAPYTPIEFYDASFNTDSKHTFWCVRVTGAVRYEPMPMPKGYCVPPPNDSDLDNISF